MNVQRPELGTGDHMDQNISIGGRVCDFCTDRQRLQDGGGGVRRWGRSQRNNRLKNVTLFTDSGAVAVAGGVGGGVSDHRTGVVLYSPCI